MRRSRSLAGAALAVAWSLVSPASAKCPRRGHISSLRSARAASARPSSPELGQDAGIFKKHGLDARHFLHPGRRRDASRSSSPTPPTSASPDRLPRHHRRLCQGRAGPHHRLDLHRRQPTVLVRARRQPDQVAEGCRRQDRGLFDQRLLDPHLGAGAEEIHRRRLRADPDRRGARHLHPGDERPDRRRLGRRAVRRRCGRAGQDPRHRQGLRRSGAGPPDHPAA